MITQSLVVSFAVAACAASVLKDLDKGYTDGDRYFRYQDDNGNLLVVDTEAPINEEFLKNSGSNSFWLYTRKNTIVSQKIIYDNTESLLYSNFDPHKITVFVVHGWVSSRESIVNVLLKEAFLLKDDVNLIVLDWSLLANENYVTSKFGVTGVGKDLGKFIDWIVDNGADYDRIHLVGFSLGAHLVGIAGRETRSQVARITSLDPAAPLWLFDRNRITENAAKYVEVIHTHISFLGYKNPCGDADFYPNGGTSMPGCDDMWCDHGRSHQYLAASIKYRHLLANECSSFEDAINNTCTGDLHHLGTSDLNKNRPGIFRVNTGYDYPY